MGQLISVLGLVLTFVGIGLAFSALVQNYRAAHGKRKPLLPWLSRAGVWFRRTVLRRSPAGHRVTVSGAGSTSWAGSAYAYTTPPADASLDRKIEHLLEQVQALHARFGVERARTRSEVGAVRKEVREARTSAQAEVRAAEALARDLATGTTQRQLLGLVLVGLGSFVGALPSLFGW